MFLDMYGGCNLMNELQIKNVDENGNEIDSIDWSVWKRIRVEEVLDENNKPVELISHCERLSDDELHQKLLNDLASSEDEDVQAALCELAEQQSAYENDVNAALCELYELIEKGSGKNG